MVTRYSLEIVNSVCLPLLLRAHCGMELESERCFCSATRAADKIRSLTQICGYRLIISRTGLRLSLGRMSIRITNLVLNVFPILIVLLSASSSRSCASCTVRSRCSFQTYKIINHKCIFFPLSRDVSNVCALF